MRGSFAILYLAAFIDATGTGLIIPILPAVLRRLAGGAPITLHYGALVASFALMQFAFAPALGMLSDRFGRRPILLLSLTGSTIDYLLTGFAPTLAILYVARVIGGITTANLSVISATIADLAPEAERARRFGAMNAALGIGWVAGPALGGMLGQISLAAPFVAAAALNGLNLVLALVLLPETRRPGAPREKLRLARMNAFASLGFLRRLPGVTPLLVIFAVICLLGQVPGSLWVLYGQARFGWSTAMVGWSFAAFGLLFAAAQAFLSGPATRHLGDRRSLLLGLTLDGVASGVMGAARSPWVPFAITPLYACGNLGVPALQGTMSRAVGSERQGELQGALASLTSLAGVVGPVLFTAVYAATREGAPGLVWFGAGLGYAACVAVIGWRGREAAAPA